MEYYVNLDLLELSVSKKTIHKWFKDCTKVVRGNHLVEFDDFVDFICNYREGKYIMEICELTQEEVDEMDYEAKAPTLLQKFFDHVMVTFTDCGNDEVNKVLGGHVFNAKFMVV